MKEDYFVEATVILDGNKIKNVPCKVFLPERINNKPYITLKPSSGDSVILTSLWRAELKAEVYNLDKKLQLIIESPEVYFTGAQTTHWGHNLTETTISGDPQDLRIIRVINNTNLDKKTFLTLWVSPNKLLSPFLSQNVSYDGTVEHKCVRQLFFEINDNVKHEFIKNYRYRTEENDDLIQWSFLVSSCQIDIPAIETDIIKNSILEDFDNFLLISSFASRERTACLGWEACDSHHFVQYYRGNYVFPEIESSNSNNELIDRYDFEKFIEKAYISFQKYNNKLALQSSLHAAVSAKESAIEKSFLTVFAGIETLILDFKRINDLEFILPENDWKELRKYLEKAVKKSTNPVVESDKRASIYKKLGELNRISLRESYDLFCIEYNIEHNGLWPLFGQPNTVGLVDIRNRIIHGDPFPRDISHSLVIANEHLKYILERAILRILNWNIEDSKVSIDHLRMVAGDDLKKSQLKLTDYLRE